MSVRSRELSQFGSFIYIDDSTRSVGIATTATPYVGIGTANPVEKLDVGGNVKIRGDLTVDGNFNYTFDSNLSLDGDISISGILTAAAFYDQFNNRLTAFDSWAISGANIYRAGSIGIGTSVFTERVNVIGNVRAGKFISTVTDSAPFTISNTNTATNFVQYLNADFLRGKSGPSGDIVGTTDTQNLTNKTLSSGTISGGIVTNVGIYSGTINNATVPVGAAISFGNIKLSALTTPLSYQLYLPPNNGTLISTTSVGVVTSGMIQDSGILSVNIAGLAVTTAKIADNAITNIKITDGTIQNIKLSNSTISGVSLGSTLNALGFTGLYWSGGTSYTGASSVNVSLAATTATTGTTLVGRNASGETNLSKIFFRELDGTSLDGASITNSIVRAYSIIAPAGGKIGINTPAVSPTYNLHVEGSINFTGGLFQNGVAFVSGGGGDSLWGSVVSGITTTSNVGIKNASPTSALDVTGDVKISGVTTSGGVNVTTGNDYKIAGFSVLTSTTLGSGVNNSSLTSVGTLTRLVVGGGGISASGIVTANGINVTTTAGINVSGVVTATSFSGNATTASGLTGTPNITVGSIVASSLNSSGIVTATDYRIGSNVVLNSTTLGTGVNNSSLTSVGTLTNLNVSGVTTTLGLNATGVSTIKDLRVNSVAEETAIVSGLNGSSVPATFTYNTGGGNIIICTNPAGDFNINVNGIPTDSSFDNNSITFSVMVLQASTARIPSTANIRLNGLQKTPRYPGGVTPSGSPSGSWDIFTFTGINTVGSASTTNNYTLFGIVNGNFR